MKKLNLLIIVSIILPSANWARQIEDWPYARLLEEADLVVIGRAVSSDESTDEWEAPFFEASRFQAFETTFEVFSTLKGKAPESIKLLHFKYREAAPTFNDGPGLISFSHSPPLAQDEIANGEGEAQLAPLSASKETPPEYLLFLQLREDGRYEPISGQLDADLSARYLGSMN